jgi:hypothetical protein
MTLFRLRYQQLIARSLRCCLVPLLLFVAGVIGSFAEAQQVQVPPTTTPPVIPPTGQATRLPGVQGWQLNAVTPAQADAALLARPIDPTLVSPVGSGTSDLQLYAPNVQQNLLQLQPAADPAQAPQ